MACIQISLNLSQFNIVNRHLPNIHVDADDTQLYLAFKPGKHSDPHIF